MTKATRPVTVSPRRSGRVSLQLGYLALLVLAMWVSEGLDALLPGTWDVFGIRPRDAGHAVGIVLSPFLHGSFAHLSANTAALVVLGALVAMVSRHFVAVTAVVVILGGAGVWLFGATGTVHIGASGLVYGYAAFLFAYGFVAARFWPALTGVLVALAYGGMVWGVLPFQPGVSWEAHLFGGLAGLVVAVFLGRRHRSDRRR